MPADVLQQGFHDLADAFASSYWVAFGVLVFTLIPVAFLPRKRQITPLEDGDGVAPPIVMH
ncbi:hypothetical protein [Aeromicrobium sp. UC242_57]|uniref:hypothetical protein n=1 Tax=Aeromicrobium sp. UC242_57 TaxID=3374624 RepID=UPI00379104B1